jgi:hypothetical protein
MERLLFETPTSSIQTIVYAAIPSLDWLAKRTSNQERQEIDLQLEEEEESCFSSLLSAYLIR